MISSKDIATAIGVCSAFADNEYETGADKQSIRWESLRSAVYFLQEELEQAARVEVSNVGE